MPAKRRSRAPAVNPKTAKSILTALKPFRDDYATVTMSQGEMSISVTFNRDKPADKPKAKPTEEEKRSPLAMLRENPPPFDFGDAS
jgi:hypothetical protein